MKTHIGLFAKLNVGGKNVLPMKELVAVLEGLGAEDVRTYIQSGNVVFRHRVLNEARMAAQIRGALKERLGLWPEVVLLDRDGLNEAASANPYPEAEAEPKSLHLFFLVEDRIKPDFAMLDAVKKANERYTLKGRVLYLHAPDGVGKSKLVGKVERALGVTATARNWNTVTKLRELAL